MQTLVTITRAQSFGHAAKSLGISQQAVSERVRAAEHSLGVTLFHRTPHGTVPTRQGEEIVHAIAQHLSNYQDFTADIERIINPGHETIQVAASQTIMEHYLPAWLATVHRDEPRMRFRVTSGNSHDIGRAVIEGTTALGFIESLTLDKALQHQLSTTTIRFDELAIAVAPSHPWARRETVPAATVRETPLILREPGSGTRSTAETALGQLASPIAELDSQTAVVQAALFLGEPAILPRIALHGTKLCAVSVEGMTIARPLRAVWRAGTHPRGGLATLLSAAGQP